MMKKGRILNNVAQNQYKPRRHKLYTQNPAFVPFWPSETVVLQTFLILTIYQFLTFPLPKYDIYLIG